MSISKVSLRPSITSRKFQHQGLKLSSDVALPTTEVPETSGRSQPIPRTRDDSSDEEETLPSSMRPMLPMKSTCHVFNNTSILLIY